MATRLLRLVCPLALLLILLGLLFLAWQPRGTVLVAGLRIGDRLLEVGSQGPWLGFGCNPASGEEPRAWARRGTAAFDLGHAIATGEAGPWKITVHSSGPLHRVELFGNAVWHLHVFWLWAVCIALATASAWRTRRRWRVRSNAVK